MRAVYVDCTSDMRKVINDQKLVVPPAVEINDGDPSPEDLERFCQTNHILLVEHTSIPKELLRANSTVRAIIFMGTGAGTYIDLDQAKSAGIQIATTRGYGDRSVAEHAMALMFSGARDVARMDRDIRIGQWRPRGGLQLQGRKLAVLGLGGIGLTFAHMAKSLGMDVAAWNRTPRNVPYFTADLDAALKDAEVVSLHLALNNETKGLLDRRRLQLPKQGFLLVNTARAELLDQAGFLEALESGQIGHAALDVFYEEPLPAGNVFQSQDHVTVTAHAAYMTEDAYAELWRRTLHALEHIVTDRALWVRPLVQ